MLILRLKKIAIKNNLHYTFVISMATIAPTSNQFLEKIGYYKPLLDKWYNKYVFIDATRLSVWLKKGVELNHSSFFLIKALFTYSLQVNLFVFIYLWLDLGIVPQSKIKSN